MMINNNDNNMNNNNNKKSTTITTSTTKRKKVVNYTNTNTDYEECLPDNANIIQRFIYSIEIHTGLKTFSLIERIICHFFLWSIVLFLLFVFIIFCIGLKDGIIQNYYTNNNPTTTSTIPTTKTMIPETTILSPPSSTTVMYDDDFTGDVQKLVESLEKTTFEVNEL